jgi:hypothetical protein
MIRRIAAPALAALTLAASAAMPLAAGAAPKDVVAVAEKRAANFANTCVELKIIPFCLLEFYILQQQVEKFIGKFTP